MYLSVQIWKITSQDLVLRMVKTEEGRRKGQRQNVFVVLQSSIREGRYHELQRDTEFDQRLFVFFHA